MKEVITLDTPLHRGDNTIDQVEVLKPGAGALRGVNLVDLAHMDVSALIKVLPRITTPTLSEQEIARMDIADLMQIGMAVTGFLAPKSAKADASLQTSTTPSPTLQ
ncbi:MULTISPECIES: phage tail assembly protein [Pandoraea]|uniref:phage tail assembly protein n=1 Tax=Pandoraea TaxID=93217 RepID=UPI001F5D382A|nr:MULTISPECIES: phage tail assembly protein [Pandoraea]MCI3205840.1 phage tail assembly protein [Pandoraea sp. LA3]MDN4583868.1 phage tail assembly protein [Pandoraea capi]